MTRQTVYVIVWTHRHGEDISVFASEAGAENYRQETAADQWDEEMGDDVKPDEPKMAADAYFEVMGEREDRAEYFEVYTKTIEP